MTYHFVITVALPDGYASYEGTVTPRAGATRQGIYRDACDYARTKTGRAGAVVFFSFEPNDLAAVTA